MIIPAVKNTNAKRTSINKYVPNCLHQMLLIGVSFMNLIAVVYQYSGMKCAALTMEADKYWVSTNTPHKKLIDNTNMLATIFIRFSFTVREQMKYAIPSPTNMSV